MNRKIDFWVIVGFMVANLAILVTIVGFMFSMNTRMDSMATKADITELKADMAQLETELKADMREIRSLIMTHIATDHKGHTHKKQIALAEKQRPK